MELLASCQNFNIHTLSSVDPFSQFYPYSKWEHLVQLFISTLAQIKIISHYHTLLLNFLSSPLPLELFSYLISHHYFYKVSILDLILPSKNGSGNLQILASIILLSLLVSLLHTNLKIFSSVNYLDSISSKPNLITFKNSKFSTFFLS